MTGVLDVDLVARAGGLEVRAAFAVGAGEVTAVVGPNGAGKTTLLRALAGLHPVRAGRVLLGGRDLTGLPAARRGVGYVPQDGALFPHLDARANVAFGLRCAGQPRRVAAEAAQRWLDRLGVGELAGRRPSRLSGGQGQRVALARALAASPGLLLLDEPLAALDPETRTAVRRTLREHLAGYGGPCLLVTHDPVDALTLAGRMLVLEAGSVTQDAPVADVVARPRSTWAAELFGHNAYEGTATPTGLRTPGGAELTVADPVAAGRPAVAVLHPQAVALHRRRPDGSPRNAWQGSVAEVTPLGGRVRVRVTGPLPVTAELTPAGAAALELAAGGEVWVSVKATEVRLVAL